MHYVTHPRKPMFPDWLVEGWVEQGARLDASGNLDLNSLKDPPLSVIDDSSDPDSGPSREV